MENIALSDSNDDLPDDIIRDNDLSRAPPRTLFDQRVTSELQDAANTDVTKGKKIVLDIDIHTNFFICLFKATFTTSANTPFKPLFPAPTISTQNPSSGSPLLFQQKQNAIPALNPLFQSPASTSNFASPLIQPALRPPTMSSPFQPPPSAFTPLNPANIQQSSSSSIQPKLTIGNPQQTMPPPLAQPAPFSIPSAQVTETANIPPPMTTPISAFNISNVQNNPQLVPPPPPPVPAPSTTMKDPNASIPPPPQQMGTSKQVLFTSSFKKIINTLFSFYFLTANVNPYSARASLTERIYPSMPTSQAPLQPQQLPPPISFQQQSVPPPTSNIFVPPPLPPVASSNVPNVFPG